MKDIYQRTHMLVGERLHNLIHSTVAVIGLGGVGSYAVEALARAGTGKLILADNDTINSTNINRQLYALHSTIGMHKTDVAKNRIADINSDIDVTAHTIFVDDTNIDTLSLSQCDYVIDAIDSVKSKLLLIQYCHQHNIPIISCMGTGNKQDASQLTVTDIYSTSMCPLARVMRRELSRMSIPSLQVVYSPEQPHKALSDITAPASISYVPSTAGLLLANKVIQYLLG